MVFSIMVLFCLAQNSGVFSALQQVSLLANGQTKAITYDSVDAAATASLTQSGGSAAKSSEFKKCELSEKSLRVCLDEPPIMPLLVLLFIFPLIPLASRQLQRALDVPVLPKPRRIHLSLCRFQE
ncbi:hypothetical protein [Shewanella pneumatophori]|uniref:Uncharacterized protein n=1 Tax=Shewanella pneumatophori TaxID=314092 RepID=A0A9X1ZAG9_9GAMM|nr:hypothetical protein [Shewanella pneumatophori]MCL1137936.1 hypothetical protein [Shewanella pneumatophori]